MLIGPLGLLGRLAQLNDVSFGIKPVADNEVLKAPLVAGRIEGAAELAQPEFVLKRDRTRKRPVSRRPSFGALAAVR